MAKRVTMLVATLLVFGCFAWSAQHVFYGTVSDSNCGAKHARASAAAKQCVTKCVSGGASYVLVSHGKVYKLDPQDKFADYAGQRVRVHGTLNGDTITAESVSSASRHRAMAPTSSGT